MQAVENQKKKISWIAKVIEILFIILGEMDSDDGATVANTDECNHVSRYL